MVWAKVCLLSRTPLQSTPSMKLSTALESSTIIPMTLLTQTLKKHLPLRQLTNHRIYCAVIEPLPPTFMSKLPGEDAINKVTQHYPLIDILLWSWDWWLSLPLLPGNWTEKCEPTWLQEVVQSSNQWSCNWYKDKFLKTWSETTEE